MPPTPPTPPRPATSATSAHQVPAEAVTPLMRGIAVLWRLTEAGGTLSPSALERATGLARSTVDRITATLARTGYVRLDGRDVVLTPRLMELGNAYLAALGLPALLDARADELADALDESVSLAVGDRDGIRFIHQATRRRAMSLSFRIGDLLPAERTAPGPLFATEWTDEDWRRWRERRAADPEHTGFPAIPPLRPHRPDRPDRPGRPDRPDRPDRPHASPLSHASHPPLPSLPLLLPLPPDDFEERTARAAREGWSVDDQLIEPGLVAVSVPVRDAADGRIVCVASVVSHTSRHSARSLRTALLPRLRETVTAMEDDLSRARRTPPPQSQHPSPSPSPTDLASWTAASKRELGREFIESLARGLTVLTAFGADRPALTLTEAAKATGLSRATVRRALITYEHLGLVEQAPDARAFTLTPRVLSLGFPPLSRTSLPRIAQPHLEDLAARVQESASLAVLTPSGDEIQYTARAATYRVMSVDFTVGTRLPAGVTALGRALTGATADGYALADEELEEGLRAIAVPVHDRAGRAVAAVNVATHAARHTREECVSELLPALRRTAAAIEADLRVAARFTRIALT
ncbi:IclR family transcriptional regulator C-terminal domain-containing protein [Streptomyces sp. NPDC047017]|uniref:IclR family transcriptional regulator domain-containing protein n=1 Tax=Streptomyces sp. NPDC047017 TaxID=3155024 RepID=UPI00340FC93E